MHFCLAFRMRLHTRWIPWPINRFNGNMKFVFPPPPLLTHHSLPLCQEKERKRKENHSPFPPAPLPMEEKVIQNLRVFLSKREGRKKERLWVNRCEEGKSIQACFPKEEFFTAPLQLMHIDTWIFFSSPSTVCTIHFHLPYAGNQGEENFEKKMPVKKAEWKKKLVSRRQLGDEKDASPPHSLPIPKNISIHKYGKTPPPPPSSLGNGKKWERKITTIHPSIHPWEKRKVEEKRKYLHFSVGPFSSSDSSTSGVNWNSHSN